MNLENPVRHSYVEMIRAHRSTVVVERQRIESQKLTLRQNYVCNLKSSKYGPLMKTYLWLNLFKEMYQFEAQEEQKLLRIRNQQERELHRLKAALLAADFDVSY